MEENDYKGKISEIIAGSPFKKPLSGLQLLMEKKKQKIRKDNQVEALENNLEELKAKHKRELEALTNKVKAEAFDKQDSRIATLPHYSQLKKLKNQLQQLQSPKPNHPYCQLA